MNDHARKWAAALRSGEFHQTTGALRNGDRYCCLGVACELYRRENGGEWVAALGGGRSFEGDSSLLPLVVRDWLGLTDSGGDSSHVASLAELNDNDYPFEEIADIIEEEPEGLFTLDNPQEMP